MKRRNRVIAALLVLLLCGCAGKAPVNHPENGTQTEGTLNPGTDQLYPLDTYTGNYNQMAEDGTYYYFSTAYDTYALDKTDWHLEKVCRDSLCEHKGMCAYSCDPDSLLGRGGQIYVVPNGVSNHYFHQGTIYELMGDWKLTKAFSGHPQIFLLFGWDGEDMLYGWYEERSDQWGASRLDLSTGTENIIYEGHVGGVEADEEWYYIWDTGRIWRIHKETGEEEELSGEYVSGMRLIGEELYYTAYDEEANRIDLKVMNKNGGEGRKVLENVTPQCFHIFEGKVLYTYYDLNNRENMNKLYSYDRASGESLLLAEDVLNASLLPGDGKLLISQQKKTSECIYSLMNIDGSDCMELVTESTVRWE